MASSHEESELTYHAMMIFTWIVYCIITQILNIFGIVTNTINIICLAKQGFKDSVNISLLSLAVSDLGSLTTMLWACICVTPPFMEADLPFDPIEVIYLTAAMPHFSFTRVSSCITAMIMLERCLCITAPLKIKSIITPRRTAVITVCVFIVFFFSGAPVYAVQKLAMTFSPLRNKTLIGLVLMNNRDEVEKISFAVNNFSIPICAFAIIVICTTTLSVQLRRTSEWRKTTITSGQGDRISNRNQKTAKMVVMISTLFIVCFVPVNITMLAVALLPELSVTGKNLNISLMICGIGYVLEGINSSMNIFIYYRMSSKYKTIFGKLFFKNTKAILPVPYSNVN